jgi:hypothetical protein
VKRAGRWAPIPFVLSAPAPAPTLTATALWRLPVLTCGDSRTERVFDQVTVFREHPTDVLDLLFRLMEHNSVRRFARVTSLHDRRRSTRRRCFFSAARLSSNTAGGRGSPAWQSTYAESSTRRARGVHRPVAWVTSWSQARCRLSMATPLLSSSTGISRPRSANFNARSGNSVLVSPMNRRWRFALSCPTGW